MNIFKLPDLGEGLPEATVREWYIKEGDSVTLDQPIVAVETAKALVDIPSPYEGVIEKCFAEVDQILETGQPLVGFEGDATEELVTVDTGTVVGEIYQSDKILQKTTTESPASSAAVTATAEARSYARRHKVDLISIQLSGTRITKKDVERHLKAQQNIESNAILSPVRQAMILSMQKANQEVANMTVQDDAIISHWFQKESLLLRSIRAIAEAVAEVPVVNAHFNAEQKTVNLHTNQDGQPIINLGIAIDTEHGLFVPVIKDINSHTDEQLLSQVETFKHQAMNKTLSAEDQKGATITLSNFGSIAAKYATPLVIPPMVGIVGIGRVYDSIIAKDQQVTIAKSLPLSVSADHRVVTGGEVIRFLAALIRAFEK